MKKTFFVSLALFLWAAPGIHASENSCIKCHSGLMSSDPTHPAHNFLDWQNSLHAQKGVACDACHGGNSQASEMSAAHQGLANSMNSESKLYFNKIPDSCGACHAKELEGFKESAHSQELNRSGKGPNCVTCHGSMASHVMSPRELESVCTLCHRRPTKAYASLLTLQTSRKLMDQLRKDLKESKSAGLDVGQQSDALIKSEQSYKEILKVWHTFDMEKVLSSAQDLNHRVHNAFHEIDLKKKSKGIEKKSNERSVK